MNDAQRRKIADRQRRMVTGDDDAPAAPAAEPAPPPRPMAEIVAEMRPDVGPGIPVKQMRFIDKTFQVAGMQSGEDLKAHKQPNGREHTIELVRFADTTCFLITFVDPARREVTFDFVERSAVKTWRLA